MHGNAHEVVGIVILALTIASIRMYLGIKLNVWAQCWTSSRPILRRKHDLAREGGNFDSKQSDFFSNNPKET